MDEDIRRVTGIVVRAPLTHRTVRELLYCGLGGLAGVIGFEITIAMLAVGLSISVSIVGTVIGLLLLTLALRVSGRLGALHRRLAGWLLRYRVEPPPKFQPGTGILNRLDKRLRDRSAWRTVSYSLVKLPVAAVQLYAITLACIGLVDITYPVDWVLFRNHASGPMTVVFPFPFIGAFHVYGFVGTYLAAIAGVVCVLAATWLARGINAGDRRLLRGLLGPRSMAERVSELERTRTLAVEDSAAALRRVERDLHDGAQMRLAALAMNLGMAQEKLGDDEHADHATVRELIDAAHRNAVDALADLRDLARGIHPPALDNGLASALATLAASSAIPASVTADIGTRPAPAIETIAYFCAAELIANATKHSYANQITINILTERTGVLRLQVIDDGIGGADAAGGSGLTGLAQRVSTVDGRIDVSSPPGGPTTVTVELPLTA
jgi:glucose-6-phosphate-specific signal transduction histidine kinase